MGLNLTSPPAMGIWKTNRNMMVIEGTMFKLGSHGNLVPKGLDRTMVWSIGTDKSKGISMANNQNFKVYNTMNSLLVCKDSNLVWQSISLKMLEGEWDVPNAPMWPLQRGSEF